MKFPQLLTLVSLFISQPIWASVKSYFNHNSHNQYVEPYRGIQRSGDNLEQIILNEIARAKKSIYIAVQEFRLPLVARALIEKKAQGIDVRVILEHDYNFTVLNQQDTTGDSQYEAMKLAELRAFVDLNGNGKIERRELETRDAIYMLQAGRVPIIDDTSDNSRGSGLMHNKFMIVDGKSTIVSTANFTMSCVHGDTLAPQSRGNANSMVVIESSPFANIFMNEFNQMWGNGKTGRFGQNKIYYGPKTVSVSGIKITVQFSPTSSHLNWEESTNGLIAETLKKSTRSVKAALFVFSDQKIADVLEKRHNAGVEMGFLVEPKFAYRDYSELLDLLGLQMLNVNCKYEDNNNPWRSAIVEGGMPILPRGDVLHHKFAVVDEKMVIMGSENWSESANYINDETLVVIQDRNIADSYTQEYLRLKKSSILGPSLKVQADIKNQEASCSRRGLYF
jgi:phosphatidylserine/phosphatidylglycerophosphate/cardiolipin synthase-like enzyme